MFELQFLKKTVSSTLFLTIFLGAFLTYYYGMNFGLGFISGSLWNVINFNSLIALVSSVFTPAKPDKVRVIKAIFKKFGLLYAGGFVIIKYSHFSLWGILSGFSLLFIVLFLKALGRVFYERSKHTGSSGTD